MRIKDSSVKIQGISTELLFALLVSDQVYQETGQELVITSLNDGKHSVTSLHYSGNAADIRIYRDGKDQQRRDMIKERLGIDYDVILESNHIHIEYQPRRR